MLALGKAWREMQAGKVGARHILLPAAAISLLLFLTTLARGEEIYLPQDLDDAHRELLRLFGPAGIAQIKALKSEEDVYTIDLGIGLTNRWELNTNSPLALFFRRRGVPDSHDMVGIVLATLWDRLHHRPLGLAAKIARLKRYYAAGRKLLPHGLSPRDGSEIDWVYQAENERRILSLGISRSDGSYWRYDSSDRLGIQPARPEEVKQLKEQEKYSGPPSRQRK